MKSTWKKLPAIEGKYGGCLNCGPRPDFLPMDYEIGVGFGYAGLVVDDLEVWNEFEVERNNDKYMTVAEAEALAAEDPDHDWRIILEAPLSSRTYQRHGPEQWALVEQGMGFA